MEGHRFRLPRRSPVVQVPERCLQEADTSVSQAVEAQVPAEVAQLLEDGVGESQVLLSTYDAVHSVKSVARGELARWEGVVIQL